MYEGLPTFGSLGTGSEGSVRVLGDVLVGLGWNV